MTQRTKRFFSALPMILALVACMTFALPSQAQTAGKYKGEMKVYLEKALSSITKDQGLRIKEIKPGTKYSMLLNPFSVSSFDIPALKCMATGKKVANGIEVSGKISDKTGAFPITGSLKGTIDKKGVAKVVYTLKFGKMPMTIYAHYVGKK